MSKDNITSSIKSLRSHAIVDLADQSSRMKDYYDLYNILSKEKYDVDTLQEAIIRTFEN